MMKQILFLMLATFALASCNDDCDHGFDGGGITSDILIGSWYEETQNEEDTYSTSSVFYSKYCNRLVQGEGQGTYRLDTERNRLTWSYHVNGMGMTSDWKLRDVTKYQFVQYSDVAVLTYGKIVDTYNMTGGETKTISFNELSVQGYESTNEHIATVSSDGLVTATGEKGTAYIKIKCLEATVYVKVIVGDNYPDLWIDYSGLLGNDYAAMKNLLGDPDNSSEKDGYSLYSYVTNLHNILQGIRVSINSDTHKVDQIDMIIKEGVPQEELLAYMNAHYYRLPGNYGTQYHYSTSSELEKSRAVYALETDTEKTGVGGCTILLMEKGLYEMIMNPAPWPDFTTTFGLTREQVKAEMDKKGYTFYQSLANYSDNGSDAYLVNGYDDAYMVEFVFNTDDQVSQYWIWLKDIYQKHLDYLNDKYYYEESEYDKINSIYPFYNEDKTLKVELNVSKSGVTYTCTAMPQHTPPILGQYWNGIGMTLQQLTNTFGQPDDKDDDGVYYIPSTDYIWYAYFLVDNAEKVYQLNLRLQDSVDKNDITEYLNKRYYYLETTETEQGPRMRWLNAEKTENATLRATYYPDYNIMVYSIPE